MLPVLINLGPVSVSSFGVFLALSLIASLFTVWRVSKAYDVDQDRVTSLTVLTFLGGLIGARILAVGLNLELFDNLDKIFQLNRYPGLSFWGGLIGGSLTFWLLTVRNRLNFWQLSDFAATGLILGAAIGTFGCFLGGCSYGITSDSWLAVGVVGLVGKRLPVALFEAVLLLILFRSLWAKVVRFHYSGQVLAQALIWLGIIKFSLEFFRGDRTAISQSLAFSFGHLMSVLLIIFGVLVVYSQSKRTVMDDLMFIKELVTSSKRRSNTLESLKKRWYNLQVSWLVRLGRFRRRSKRVPKFTMRRLNVKFTPKNAR